MRNGISPHPAPKGLADCTRNASSTTLVPQNIERPREIQDAINSLFTSTDVLSDRIATLEKRLDRVLVSRPNPIDSDKAPEAATEMGSSLSAIASRIRLMSFAVESIEERLEL